jgi:rhodanese-related sulfurtransferase
MHFASRINILIDIKSHRMSAHAPPPGAKSIAQILEEARAHLTRIMPSQLYAELQSQSPPIHLIDIRPAAQREDEGNFDLPPNHQSFNLEPTFHRVHIIERNVLEWRLDPQCEARLKDVIDHRGYETRIIVFCSEGYTSSLAAKELKKLGLGEATDLVGGQKGWQRFLANTGTNS